MKAIQIVELEAKSILDSFAVRVGFKRGCAVVDRWRVIEDKRFGFSLGYVLAPGDTLETVLVEFDLASLEKI